MNWSSDRNMIVQEPPNCTSQTVQFSSAVVDYVDSDEGFNRSYSLLGGLSRDAQYAWMSRGPNFEVVSVQNGEKVAAWTFGGILKDTNTKVTCAVELPTIEDGYGVSISSLYAVGLDCYLSCGMVCLFDIHGSKILKAIQVPGKVTSLAVVDPGLIPEATTPLAAPLRLARGILAIGLSPGGRILLLDLCLSEEDGGAAEGVPSAEEEYGSSRLHAEHSNELNPSCVVVHAPGDPRTEGPVAPGEHMAIFLNERSFANGFFMLTVSDSTYRLPLSHVEITASLYVPQLASLFVGFSFGTFQVWDLGNLSLVHTSPLMSEPRNITYFAFQEPADDPKKYCYIWTVHGRRWNEEGDEVKKDRAANEDVVEDLAFARMHYMFYQSKEWIDAYGWIYQGFVSISGCFGLEFTHSNMPNTISRCISCQSLDGSKGRFPFLGRVETADFEEGNTPESDLSLCCFVWQSWRVGMDGNPCDLHHTLTLFDLNQWYREQMPSELTQLVAQSQPDSPAGVDSSSDGGTFTYHPGSPHLMTYALPFVTERVLSANGAPLLGARINPTSVSRFCATAIPIPEEHLFPSALAFESSFLLGSKCVVNMSTPGLQRSLLAKLQFSGPKTYLYPMSIFYECIAAGLKPLYVDIHNPAAVPVSEQREFLLSLALEHHLVSYLIRCAVDTVDGRASSLGVTLGFLVSWVKKRAWVLRDCVSKLCIPLFECGGALLPDPQASRLMSLCGRQLNHLSSLLREILNRCYSWIIIEEAQEIQQWCDVLGVLALHTEVVQWFCHVGLLPELADEDCAAAEMQASSIGVPRIPYPAKTLVEAYEKRRKELEGVAGLSRVSDILFIDGAVRECGERLTKETWQNRSSKISSQYPPPSLQALLQTYLLDGLPVEDKHCLVIYLFLDLAALLSNERYESSIGQLIKFPSAFSLSPSIIKLTQAFWLLDHKDFETAINVFLDPLICPQDIKLWQHRCAVRSFLIQGEPQKALKYLRVRQPPLGGIEDLKLNLSLLLENGLVHEAFNYQRKHSNSENSRELLEHFFNGCSDLKQLRWVLQNSLTPAEEDGLMTFLSSQKHAKAQEICVMYYLQRSRVIEALHINSAEKIAKKKMKIIATDDVYNKRLKSVRDAIVSGYASALPSVTRRLAAYCAQHSGTLHSWKEVTKPVPTSVDIHRMKEKSSIPFTTKSTLIGTMLDKARETWNPPPLPPIPSPTPQRVINPNSVSTSRKRKLEEEDASISFHSKKLFSPLRTCVESMPFICTPVATSQLTERNGHNHPVVFPSQAKSFSNLEEILSPFKRARRSPFQLNILTSSPLERKPPEVSSSPYSSAISLLQTPTVPRRNRKMNASREQNGEEYSWSGGSTSPHSLVPRTPQSILKVKKATSVYPDSAHLAPAVSHAVGREGLEYEEGEGRHGIGRLIHFKLPTGLTPSPSISSPVLNGQNEDSPMHASPHKNLSRPSISTVSPLKAGTTEIQNRSQMNYSTKNVKATKDASTEVEYPETKMRNQRGLKRRSTIHPSTVRSKIQQSATELMSGDESGEFYSFEEVEMNETKEKSNIETEGVIEESDTSYMKLFPPSPSREVKSKKSFSLFGLKEEENEMEQVLGEEEESVVKETSEVVSLREDERREEMKEEEGWNSNEGTEKQEDIVERTSGKDLKVKEVDDRQEMGEIEQDEVKEELKEDEEESSEEIEKVPEEEMTEFKEEEIEEELEEEEVRLGEEKLKEIVVECVKADGEEEMRKWKEIEVKDSKERSAEDKVYENENEGEEEMEDKEKIEDVKRQDGIASGEEQSEILELGTSEIFSDEFEACEGVLNQDIEVGKVEEKNEPSNDDEEEKEFGREMPESSDKHLSMEAVPSVSEGNEDDDEVVVISDSDDDEAEIELRLESEGNEAKENWEEEENGEYTEEYEEEMGKEGNAGSKEWMRSWEKESGVKRGIWTDQEEEDDEDEEVEEDKKEYGSVEKKIGKSLIMRWQKESGMEESRLYTAEDFEGEELEDEEEMGEEEEGDEEEEEDDDDDEEEEDDDDDDDDDDEEIDEEEEDEEEMLEMIRIRRKEEHEEEVLEMCEMGDEGEEGETEEMKRKEDDEENLGECETELKNAEKTIVVDDDDDDVKSLEETSMVSSSLKDEIEFGERGGDEIELKEMSENMEGEEGSKNVLREESKCDNELMMSVDKEEDDVVVSELTSEILLDVTKKQKTKMGLNEDGGIETQEKAPEIVISSETIPALIPIAETSKSELMNSSETLPCLIPVSQILETQEVMSSETLSTQVTKTFQSELVKSAETFPALTPVSETEECMPSETQPGPIPLSETGKAVTSFEESFIPNEFQENDDDDVTSPTESNDNMEDSKSAIPHAVAKTNENICVSNVEVVQAVSCCDAMEHISDKNQRTEDSQRVELSKSIDSAQQIRVTSEKNDYIQDIKDREKEGTEEMEASSVKISEAEVKEGDEGDVSIAAAAGKVESSSDEKEGKLEHKVTEVLVDVQLAAETIRIECTEEDVMGRSKDEVMDDTRLVVEDSECDLENVVDLVKGDPHSPKDKKETVESPLVIDETRVSERDNSSKEEEALHLERSNLNPSNIKKDQEKDMEVEKPKIENDDDDDDKQPDVGSQIEEYATSRRLTRHQMALMSRSLGVVEGGVESSLSSVKKRGGKPKTPPRSPQVSGRVTPTMAPSTPTRSSSRIRNINSKIMNEMVPVAKVVQKSGNLEGENASVENIHADIASQELELNVRQEAEKKVKDEKTSPDFWSSQFEERFKKLRRGSPVVDSVASRTRHRGLSTSPQSSVSVEIRQSPELRESVDKAMPEEEFVRMGSPAPSVASSIASSVSQRTRRRSLHKGGTEDSPAREHLPRSRQRSLEPDGIDVRRSARLSRGASLSPVNDSISEASSYASSVTSTRSRRSQTQRDEVDELPLRSGKRRGRPPMDGTLLRSGPKKRGSKSIKSTRGAARILDMAEEDDNEKEQPTDNDHNRAFVFSPPTQIASSSEGLQQMKGISSFPLSPPAFVVPAPAFRRTSCIPVISLGSIPEVRNEDDEVASSSPVRIEESEVMESSMPLSKAIPPKKRGRKPKTKVEGAGSREKKDNTEPTEGGSTVAMSRRTRSSSISFQTVDEEEPAASTGTSSTDRRRPSSSQEKTHSPTSSITSDVDDVQHGPDSNISEDDSVVRPKQKKDSSKALLRRRKTIMPIKPRKSAKL